MRTCGLVTAGECGSRLMPCATLTKEGIGKSTKPRTGADELQRTCTPKDTARDWHCSIVSACTGNPGSAAVPLPDCNCGSVGLRRLRMINRAVIQTSSHNR